MNISTAAVLGTGAWGTTFAQVLADAGVSVTMWGRNPGTIAFINGHENPTYLPGITLSDRIDATEDIASAVAGRQLVVVAVPVKAVRPTLEAVTGAFIDDVALLSLAKGLELGSLKRVGQIMAEASGVPEGRIAVLSGPNLSREIADRNPTATVVAASDVELAKDIARACHNSYFRPYVSADVVGTEMAGATKNVIAVAIGAAEGMGLGINTRSTLITRGLAEMTRLGIALGADAATFAGLAGIGDLVATCSSRLSRNFSLGHRLGAGMSLAEAVALSPGVVEGVTSAGPILQVAASVGVDMPITGAVVEVVEGRATIEDMGRMLLSRPQKMDGWKIELV
ncbi:NAD(P)-dependent glycerol-3-phosphate dehydrogenase [Schaalia meyeri]|uniref:Glycerol-3-phosphate dehydrogenase [NAD(P)+] n=1 Tax=Schaalia meyeri TaxID=52773 RepID=A0AAP9Y917_9ACTO|nr:NAD(P)H-dependent glycerol-3-phosphate dehydrogenase [Schaalia meyeri]QQC44195.1 NAD(P)-dependent glycerol-3-phosphate dehydrogenase [Schaalia meyeri]SDR67117.1 glycerol-3-phosphate dehydrogenase (NAD(P)+) [Schaalia meyeri]